MRPGEGPNGHVRALFVVGNLPRDLDFLQLSKKNNISPAQLLEILFLQKNPSVFVVCDLDGMLGREQFSCLGI